MALAPSRPLRGWAAHWSGGSKILSSSTFDLQLKQMIKFKQYDVVQVVQINIFRNNYDSWKINRQAPKIGDVGTIVEILSSPDQSIRYVVESVAKNGETLWLSDLEEEELQLLSL